MSLAILSALGNAFIVIVLTLYFLASLDTVKHGLYRLAPASRRDRVEHLGDRILDGIGGYVSGAFLVALCAGISSLIFLFIVGLGEYAVALAVVVALLDVIPMIGATLGAVIVSAIGFATDIQVGIACIIFYLVYQQLENYVIYPRVMSKSVDIPGVDDRDRRPGRGQPARRRRRPARHPDRRCDPAARARGGPAQAGPPLAAVNAQSRNRRSTSTKHLGLLRVHPVAGALDRHPPVGRERTGPSRRVPASVM